MLFINYINEITKFLIKSGLVLNLVHLIFLMKLIYNLVFFSTCNGDTLEKLTY